MPAGLDGNPDPIVTESRSDVITQVAEVIIEAKQRSSEAVLVAIDGIDGSGKSTFADEVAAELAARGVPALRSTIDSFHNPRDVRWKRGKSSPLGFYLDSHDLDAVQNLLLKPLHQGTGDYALAAFDEPTDQPVELEYVAVRGGELLIFDGIFAQRPELADYWDLTIWLDGQQRVDLRRLGLMLDDLPTEPVDVVGHVLTWQVRIDRYSSGMRHYLDLMNPAEAATIVIDNNNLAEPSLRSS